MKKIQILVLAIMLTFVAVIGLSYFLENLSSPKPLTSKQKELVADKLINSYKPIYKFALKFVALNGVINIDQISMDECKAVTTSYYSVEPQISFPNNTTYYVSAKEVNSNELQLGHISEDDFVDVVVISKNSTVESISMFFYNPLAGSKMDDGDFKFYLIKSNYNIPPSDTDIKIRHINNIRKYLEFIYKKKHGMTEQTDLYKFFKLFAQSVKHLDEKCSKKK